MSTWPEKDTSDEDIAGVAMLVGTVVGALVSAMFSAAAFGVSLVLLTFQQSVGVLVLTFMVSLAFLSRKYAQIVAKTAAKDRNTARKQADERSG